MCLAIPAPRCSESLEVKYSPPPIWASLWSNHWKQGFPRFFRHLLSSYLQQSSYFSFPVVRGRWWQNANFILPACSCPKGNLNHMVIGSICRRNSQGDSNNDSRPAPQATPAISTIMPIRHSTCKLPTVFLKKLPSGDGNRSCC